MKLLLENWRKMNAAADILDNIPDWSIVRKGDELFLFSGRDLRPLDHIDIGTFSGVVERSAYDHAGGVIHMKRAAMLDQLQDDPDWIKVVLNPAEADKVEEQFKLFRNKIMKKYEEEGVAGPLFTDKFKRDHPVEIDLENLTVALV
jgi:hypothetical protein